MTMNLNVFKKINQLVNKLVIYKFDKTYSKKKKIGCQGLTGADRLHRG